MAHIGLYFLLLMMVVVVVLSESTTAGTTTSTTPAPTKAPVATPAPDVIKDAVVAVFDVPRKIITSCAELSKAALGSIFDWGK